VNGIELSGAATTKTRNISRKGAKHVQRRRRDRKEIKLPDLAFFRLRSRQAWREQIPVLDSHAPAESLHEQEGRSALNVPGRCSYRVGVLR
jgi:hypothetical protein